MNFIGFHSLYDWYHSKEGEHFPDPTGLRGRIERWTFGFYPACVKYLMSAFDVPELMAITRSNICKQGLNDLPRGLILVYYSTVFLYYWIFSCPIVSLVFGSYLYTCINWFHLHFDEAFSSLRIANYKSFTRCHITPKGDLHVYTLAIDKVPKQWALDPYWEAEQACQKRVASHMQEFPSKWTPIGLYRERNCNVRIIDFFKIEKKLEQINTNNTSFSPVKSTKMLEKMSLGENESIGFKPNDCVHGEELTCSDNLRKVFLSSDSISDCGEDIAIENSIMNWCDNHEVIGENKLLESTNARGGEPPNLNKKQKVSSMVESRISTSINHEPPLWEMDVSVVLSDELIEPCALNKDVNDVDSSIPNKDVHGGDS